VTMTAMGWWRLPRIVAQLWRTVVTMMTLVKRRRQQPRPRIVLVWRLVEASEDGSSSSVRTIVVWQLVEATKDRSMAIMIVISSRISWLG